MQTLGLYRMTRQPIMCYWSAGIWTHLNHLGEKMDQQGTLKFGPVAIVKGQYKGRVGFYDDDLSAHTAIVYLGAPFVSPSVNIRHNCLVNVESLDIEKFRRANPEFCSMMGL